VDVGERGSAVVAVQLLHNVVAFALSGCLLGGARAVVIAAADIWQGCS